MKEFNFHWKYRKINDNSNKNIKETKYNIVIVTLSSLNYRHSY